MQLMIISMIIGIVFILGLIRSAIIHVMIGTGKRFFTVPSTYIAIIAFLLPVITGFHEQFNNHALSALRFPAVAMLWITFVGILCVFKNIGILIIGKDYLKSTQRFDKYINIFIA